MKKSLIIVLFIFAGYSLAQAQECFLGKNQNFIMDSLSKINYRDFRGQIGPDGNYTITFNYDELQDTAFLKKLDSAKIMPMQDTVHIIHYSFLFNNGGGCISSTINYDNFKDYEKVIADLDSHYKNKSKRKSWINSSGQIEVIVTKSKYTNSFSVDFHKVKQ